MSQPSLRVLARCRVRADRIDEAKAVMVSLLAPSQAEEGCILYVLQQNRQDPADFAFVEEWTDEAALAAHGKTPHILAAREKFPDLLDGPMDVRMYSLVD